MTKIKICSSLVLLLFFFSSDAVKTQAQKQDNFCQPTIEEILFAINPVKDWNPSFDGVLIAGELKSMAILGNYEKSLSITQAIAMLGGTLRTAQQPIYLIRQSTDKKRNKIEVDLNKIKKGDAEDIKLQKGDILFVSRGCENGKLLPATKPTLPFLQPNPDLTDSPITRKDRIY